MGIVKLDWFMLDKLKFIGLTKILAETENDKVFETKFVELLINEFWPKN